MQQSRLISTAEFIGGIRAGERTILARAITLIESHSSRHQEQAREVLKGILPFAGNSIRVGISGIPGAGKSTFIEAFGHYLCETGHRVAVLAVDPSSSLSRGSILGDKTRMESLSQHPNSFIRPSPSGGVLGGVARKTREGMLLCEAAGFDVILIETVGVGQSEAVVRSMVDFFLLLTIAGAGDEMQHIKKGILELADAIVVNKADGDTLLAAEQTRNEMNMALHYSKAEIEGWETKAYLCSSLLGSGIKEVWEVVADFDRLMIGSGMKEKRRREQLLSWLEALIIERLRESFFSNAAVADMYPEVEKAVQEGSLSPTSAVEPLLKAFFSKT